MRRIAPAALVLVAFASLGAIARAGDPAPAAAPSPAPSAYGDTYTPEELAALDALLLSGNLTRADLTFRKDMARGHGCLPIVREMLRDPLLIAPVMDAIARAGAGAPGRVQALHDCLRTASRLYLDTLPPSLPPAAPPAPLVPAPDSAGQAVHALAEWLGQQPEIPFQAGTVWAPGEDEAWILKVLRRYLPDEMAWHEVFPSPYDAATNADLEARTKEKPAEWLHDMAARIDVPSLVDAWIQAFLPVLDAVPEWGPEAFPLDQPVVLETEYGRIGLGTPKDDVWRGEWAVLVDPGGNDRYEGCRLGTATGVDGRRLGLFLDLAGDDTYACGEENLTLGAAVLGLAGFFDLGAGNDRYEGGHGSLAAAVGGVAVFHDDGGSDHYFGRAYTQGAAGFGVALFHDAAAQARPKVTSDEGTKDPVEAALFDNDRLHAWTNAQGFSRPKGVALCVNARGNDEYEAGGVYLHAPLFADRYQSFSQGFSIGARNVDYAGGVAMLIDRDGNDRYLGDIYNQGVGYWYAAGFLWDGAGNDLYEMTQYGQGSGIHLAVGGLVDGAGNDAYVMHSGLGQGGSHDYAASILHDRGGNDRYFGMTSCNGTGLTNAVGIHIDRAGDDTYAARRDGGLNAGRPARGYGSVGLLVDMGGRDDYLGAMADASAWRGSDLGLGVDLADPAKPEGPGGGTPAADQVSGRAEVPAVCSHEGPLDPKVFDELWAIAVRWEVGDNRYIVPKARERLVKFGKEVIPLLDGKVEKDESGLEIRAFQDVLKGVAEADPSAKPLVGEFLRKNAASPSDRRRRVALALIGEMAWKDLEGVVADLLKGPDDLMARRAAGVLGALGSRAGDEVLVAWLAKDDERHVLTALGTLLGGKADVYPKARALHGHALVSVRVRLATLLAEQKANYGPALLADLAASDLPPRARRAVVDAVVRADLAPDAAAVAAAEAMIAYSDDAGLRADACRLVRHWASRPGADAEVLRPAVALVDALAALEAARPGGGDPFLKAATRPPPK